jgi:hypothetical protein
MENVATHGIAGRTADDLQKDTAYEAAQQCRQRQVIGCASEQQQKGGGEDPLLGLRR